jgi:hypothetical protein
MPIDVAQARDELMITASQTAAHQVFDRYYEERGSYTTVFAEVLTRISRLDAEVHEHLNRSFIYRPFGDE